MNQSHAPFSPIDVPLHGLKIDSKTVKLDGLILGGIVSLSYDEPDPRYYGILTVKLYIDRSHLELDLPPRFNPADSVINTENKG